MISVIYNKDLAIIPNTYADAINKQRSEEVSAQIADGVDRPLFWLVYDDHYHYHSYHILSLIIDLIDECFLIQKS